MNRMPGTKKRQCGPGGLTAAGEHQGLSLVRESSDL